MCIICDEEIFSCKGINYFITTIWTQELSLTQWWCSYERNCHNTSNPTLHLKQSQEFWSIEVQLFQECTLQGNCGDSSEFILDLKQKIKCNTIKWWLELSALVNFCIALQQICIEVCCNKVLPAYLALAWIVSAISVKECKKCSCQNYFFNNLTDMQYAYN